MEFYKRATGVWMCTACLDQQLCRGAQLTTGVIWPSDILSSLPFWKATQVFAVHHHQEALSFTNEKLAVFHLHHPSLLCPLKELPRLTLTVNEVIWHAESTGLGWSHCACPGEVLAGQKLKRITP